MDMEVDAEFFAKEDGIIALIALAEMIFYQDDHSLKPEWSKKDVDTVHNELQFRKVSGKAHKIVVAERVVLNVMQTNEWNSNVKEALHASGAYTQLVNEENVEKLEWLQICNKSKVSVNIEKVKPYYLSLLEKEEAN